MHLHRRACVGVDAPPCDVHATCLALGDIDGTKRRTGWRGERGAAEGRVRGTPPDVDGVRADLVCAATGNRHRHIEAVVHAVAGEGRRNVGPPKVRGYRGGPATVDVDVSRDRRRGVGVERPTHDANRAGSRLHDVERALRVTRRQRHIGTAERRVDPAARVDRVHADAVHAAVELTDQGAESVRVAHARVRSTDIGAVA